MTPAHAEPTSDSTFGTYTVKESARFDTLIVFGEGPVRPVLLEDEISPVQLQHWKAYRDEPFSHQEPDFWLIQQPKYLQQIFKIQQEDKITHEEKARLTELKRQEWQSIGWFGMKTMGRQNALAAGYALYKGLTKKIIFTGGRTLSPWAKELLSQERLAAWPSEAALMKHIVIAHYGDLYEKKYGRMIDDAVLIEDAATNTLENISFVLNKYPELLEQKTRVGYLSARHHLKRIKLLTRVYSLECEEQRQLLAAQELIKQAHKSAVEVPDVATLDVDEQNYLDAKVQCSSEERWRKGLKDPEYVTYWLGYLADVKYPRLIEKTLKRLCDDLWREATKEALAKVGVNFDEYRDCNLCDLAKNKPEKYAYLISCLRKLKSPEHRKFPTLHATTS